MGTSIRHRAFADQNLFMAMNTQPKVHGMTLNRCEGEDEAKVCNTWHQKWSYAIPLEIIYLTPLSNWNPYNIEFKGKDGQGHANTVTANGRNGDLTKEKAFDGTNTRKFYRTPVEFFAGNEVEVDAADTTKNSAGVLDKNGLCSKVSDTSYLQIKIHNGNVPTIFTIKLHIHVHTYIAMFCLCFLQAMRTS